MILGHVGAVPVEELLGLVPAAGACWLALRAACGKSREV